jgi:hypothetical protein
VQFLAEDSEEELGLLLDEIVSESATKISWSQVAWTPTVTGMTLGNGSITGSAFRLGQLVWADFQILPHQVNPPTTAWIANAFPVITLPPSVPVKANLAGHDLAAAKISGVTTFVVNMAVELAPSNNTAALLAIEGAMRTFNYPSVSLGGTAVWSNSNYVRCGLMYITNAS